MTHVSERETTEQRARRWKETQRKRLELFNRSSEIRRLVHLYQVACDRIRSGYETAGDAQTTRDCKAKLQELGYPVEGIQTF